MTAPLSRPTLVCLIAEGDEILLSIQRNGVAPLEHHRATVVRLEDDEPNRRIHMTVRIDALNTTATNAVKPGELVHRVDDGNDPHSAAYVRAADLWKWEGALLDDPDGNGKVRLIRAERTPDPEDGREVLALLVQDSQHQHKAIIVDPAGGMFCEWEDVEADISRWDDRAYGRRQRRTRPRCVRGRRRYQQRTRNRGRCVCRQDQGA